MSVRENTTASIAEPSATADDTVSVRTKEWLRKQWLSLATTVGFSAGLILGLVLQQIHLSVAQKLWIAMPGVLYIRVLQLTIVPALATSIFNESDKSGTHNSTGQKEYGYQISYIFHDLLLNAFPADLTKLSIAHVGTDFEHPEKNAANETVYRKIDIDGVNMLGILFCSVAFGLAANAVNEEAEPLKQFSLALYEVVLILMRKFILATPIGVCFMVMSAVADVHDMAGTFAQIGLFFAAHLAAQFAHFLLVNSFFMLVCKNPFHLLKHCLSSWLISVATGNRMVAMPHFYQTCDDYGLPESVSRLVLPLCLMLKADGSAIFIASASFFIAQAENVRLDITKICILIDRICCGETALSSIYCTAFVSSVRERGRRSGFWKDLDDSDQNVDPLNKKS
ncbi:Neutral amino acid transporter A [Taenia solium]|eukprot:TsM_000263400 transcript=TsM_000263400 gene=TsM_000263400